MSHISDKHVAQVSAVLLVLFLNACSTNSGSVSTPSGTNANAEVKTPNTDNAKALQKISMAIGQEVNQFTISGQQKIDAPMGQNGTQYAVQTKAGKTYKCDIYEPSGFGNVVMWGAAVGSSAMCTDFTKGSADAGKTNKTSCNALLKAAGKC